MVRMIDGSSHRATDHARWCGPREVFDYHVEVQATNVKAREDAGILVMRSVVAAG